MPMPRKYTDDQREAVAAAQNGWNMPRIKPVERITELAAAGKLTLHGEPLEPFDVPPASVRDIGAKAEAKRIGSAPNSLHGLPHNEAVDKIRQRLLGIIGYELDSVEAAQRKYGKRPPVDAERLRQLARAAREVAALPATPAAPRPAAPGDTEPGTGKRTSSRTRGGLAAAAAVARNAPTPQTDPQPAPDNTQDAHEEQRRSAPTQDQTTHNTNQQEEEMAR